MRKGERIVGLVIGFCVVALLGVAHHCALIFLKNRTARAKEYPNIAMISAFLGLSLLHLAELLASQPPTASY